MDGYYITIEGEKIELELSSVISSIYFVKSNEFIFFNDNLLTQHIKTIRNEIVELVVPDGVNSVICTNNFLRKIDTNKSYNVYIEGNDIEEIKIGESLRELKCDMATPINPYDYPKIKFQFY